MVQCAKVHLGNNPWARDLGIAGRAVTGRPVTGTEQYFMLIGVFFTPMYQHDGTEVKNTSESGNDPIPPKDTEH